MRDPAATCLRCVFWHAGTSTCRFDPPTVVSTIDGLQTAWPSTEGSDWCGDWTPPSNADGEE